MAPARSLPMRAVHSNHSSGGHVRVAVTDDVDDDDALSAQQTETGAEAPLTSTTPEDQLQQPHHPLSSKAAAVRSQLQWRADQAAELQDDVERSADAAAQQLHQPLSSSHNTQSDAVELTSISTATTPRPGPASPTAAAAAAGSVAVPAAPNALDRLFMRLMPKRMLGVFYLALSAVIFSMMALCVSLVSSELPSFEIVLARSIMQFCLGATSCYYLAGANPLGPPAKRKWLTIRGLMGFISFSCYYYAMSRLTLADSTTIMFSSPLYTGILGWIFLRERVSKFDISLTLISIVGVLMVVRPRALFGDQGDLEAVPVGAEDDSALLHTMGLMAAIAGSIVSAFVYVAIRKVGPGVNPLVLVSYMGMMGSFLAPFGAAVQTFHVPSSAGAWGLLLGVGLLSYVGQVFFNAGVQLEKAGPASMIRNLDVAFSFFWQVTVLDVSTNVWSVFGALIISACVATMGLRKWRAQNREEAEAAAARALAAAQAQKELERAVPAAAHLITTPEEAQELSSGTQQLARLRPLSINDDEEDDADGGVMMRKYSLELDASDVIVHEGSYSSPPTVTNAAAASPSYAAVPAPPATARARLL